MLPASVAVLPGAYLAHILKQHHLPVLSTFRRRCMRRNHSQLRRRQPPHRASILGDLFDDWRLFGDVFNIDILKTSCDLKYRHGCTPQKPDTFKN